MSSPAEGPTATASIAAAREVLAIEAQAVTDLIAHIDARFEQAIRILLQCRGRVVVSGIGKSGHIARKMAATLASTGTPAFFVHPAEASHGDLGMITRDDVVLALSNSGETHELLDILAYTRRFQIPLVAITRQDASTLGESADVVLPLPNTAEACPNGLAPTTSTTLALALGDALAVALLDARGFRPEDFARSHPGGALGRRLLTHVRDVMRSGDHVPRVAPEATFSELMREMSAKGLGASAIVDAGGQLLGIFTDGDLRRCIEAGADLRNAKASDVMHLSPRRISPDALAVDAAEMMEAHAITSVLVVDAGGQLAGVVHIGDLMRAKVI